MKSSGKRSRLRLTCSNEHPGLDAIEIGQVFIEHHLAPTNDQDPLLDRGRRDELQRTVLLRRVGHAARMADEPDAFVYIGAPGFEPGTSPTRTVRATRLRHAPRAAIISERRAKRRPAPPAPAATLPAVGCTSKSMPRKITPDPGAGAVALAPAARGPRCRRASSASRRRARPARRLRADERSRGHEREAAALLVADPAPGPGRGRAGLVRLRPRGRARRGSRASGCCPSSGARPDGWRRSSIDMPVKSAWQRWGWAKLPARSGATATGPAGASGRKTRNCRTCRSAAGRSGTRRTSSPSPAARPGRFARLIRISGRVLHRADPGAKVIVGGLFGRPLQIPPNVASGDYLSRFYRARSVKRYFDGVALHPYVADARAMGAQIGQPAPHHARPQRRRDAALRDRAGLGVAQRADPLGARADGPGEPALAGLLDALGQAPALAGRRRLVVHLDRRRGRLPVLPLGRAADREARGEAVLVPVQRLDRR